MDDSQIPNRFVSYLITIHFAIVDNKVFSIRSIFWFYVKRAVFKIKGTFHMCSTIVIIKIPYSKTTDLKER